MQLIDKKELETGRITGILPVQGGPSLPVWMVCGVSDGPTLVLTAGVHGWRICGDHDAAAALCPTVPGQDPGTGDPAAAGQW